MPYDSPLPILLPPATLVPTFAEVIAQIPSWTWIPKKRRDDIASALTTAARMLGMPPAAIPGDPAWLNERLFKRQPAAFGIRKGRARNIVSLIRAALRVVGQHAPDLRVHDALPPAWAEVLEVVTNIGRNAALTGFARFCAKACVMPAEVGDEHLAGFVAERQATTLSAANGERGRTLASAWNACVAAGLPGWPTQRLSATPRRKPYTLPFTAFPESFQADIARFREQIGGQGGRFVISNTAHQRLRPATVAMRVFSLRQAAGLLVQSGIPPEQLTSLRDLVQPLDRVMTVLDRLSEMQTARTGEADPVGSQLAVVAETLRQVAIHHAKLDPDSTKRISDWARQARGRRGEGLTRKNRDRLRALIQPRARALVLHLPEELMRRAHAIGPGQPGAGRLAMEAVALEILLNCPLRRASLLALRLDEHLQRLDPRRRRITHLVLQPDDMKNAIPFEWPLPAASAALIEIYIRDFRPAVATPENPWLFPGQQGALSGNQLSNRLVTTIEEETGVRLHLHLLRHFAAWLHLQAHPGAYEDVRRVLGHKSVETTIAHYIAFEAAAAALRFDEVVLRERQSTRAVAAARWGKPKRQPKAPRP